MSQEHVVALCPMAANFDVHKTVRPQENNSKFYSNEVKTKDISILPGELKKSLHVLRVMEYEVCAWAVGDYCVSLKVLKSPNKEIHSFKLTMLWLSLLHCLLPNISTNAVCTTQLWPCGHQRHGEFPIPSLFRVWGLPRTTRTSYRGTVLNQCNMALAPTRPQLWCAYCIGGDIWQKTMKKKETTTAS